MAFSLTRRIEDARLAVGGNFDIETAVRLALEDYYKAGVDVLTLIDLDFGHDPRSVPGRWRPSRLHRCMRRQIYRMHKVAAVEAPFSLHNETRFTRGKLFGAWAQALLKATENRRGVGKVDREVVAFCPQTEIGGKIDAVITFGGKRYIVEVKSKETNIDDVKIGDTDLQQLNDYMGVTGDHQGFLMYFGPKTVDRNVTFWFKVFPVLFDESRYKRTLDRIAQLTWFARDATRLAPATDNKWFECSNCQYKAICDRSLSPKAAKDARPLPPLPRDELIQLE